jgi:hypothetical protein
VAFEPSRSHSSSRKGLWILPASALASDDDDCAPGHEIIDPKGPPAVCCADEIWLLAVWPLEPLVIATRWHDAPISAPRHDGMVAPMLIEGPMNGELFPAYVDFVPTLKPDDIAVVDNVATHKVAGVAEAIEAAAQRFAISRSTRPILIRSRCPSANSRRTCASLHSALSRADAAAFALSSRPSRGNNVPTISGMPAMLPYDRKPL